MHKYVIELVFLLIQVMSCCLFVNKLFPELLVIYYQLSPPKSLIVIWINKQAFIQDIIFRDTMCKR